MGKKLTLLAPLLALLPVAVTAVFYFIGFLESAENRTIDIRYNLMNPGHPVSKDIMMVDLDEQSYKAYSQELGSWPWPRAVYESSLKYIAAGEPRLILFDITFLGATVQEFDESLAFISGEIAKVSHAVTFRHQDTQKGEEEIKPSFPRKIKDQDGNPLPEEEAELHANIQKQALTVKIDGDAIFKYYNRADFPEGDTYVIGRRAPFMHSVTMNADRDGINRRARLLFKYHDNKTDYYFPSLSLRAFDAAHKLTLIEQGPGRLRLETNETKLNIPLNNGMVRIHYPPEHAVRSIPRISFAAVRQSSYAASEADLLVKPEEFQDKIVIIGTSAAAAFDVKKTPYGPMPGMYLHAILYSNMRSGHFLNKVPLWVGLIAVFILVLAMTAQVMHTQSLFWRVAVPALMYFAYMGTGAILFMNHVALPFTPFAATFPAAFLMVVVLLTVTEGREKRKFKSAMSKYLSPDVLTEVMARGDLQAEVGERRVITVMFTDIRSFTTLSEGKDPAYVVEILNEYLDKMVNVIFDEAGTLDKYIGDAIMAFWNAPIERPDHALRAVRAGMKMLDELEALYPHWQEREAPLLKMGVGAHTGEMIVGNIGSNKRLDYTVIGDNVNLGSRLEGLTKPYGVGMLISEETYNLVKATIVCRPIDLVAVKGKSIPITVFEPLGDRPRIAGMTNADYAAEYTRAFTAYKNRDFDTAVSIYERFLKTTRGPEDDVSAAEMIRRCRELQATPPAEGWNGVHVMTSK